MKKEEKNANISNKEKTKSGFQCFCLFRLSVLTGTKRPQGSVQHLVPGGCPGSGSKSVRDRVGPVLGRSGSDAGELVPEAGRQDALHLLHDEVERSKQRAEELRGRGGEF